MRCLEQFACLLYLCSTFDRTSTAVASNPSLTSACLASSVPKLQAYCEKSNLIRPQRPLSRIALYISSQMSLDDEAARAKFDETVRAKLSTINETQAAINTVGDWIIFHWYAGSRNAFCLSRTADCADATLDAQEAGGTDGAALVRARQRLKLLEAPRPRVPGQRCVLTRLPLPPRQLSSSAEERPPAEVAQNAKNRGKLEFNHAFSRVRSGPLPDPHTRRHQTRHPQPDGTEL